MAWVTLEEPDREGAVLPDVCMKCGARALDRVFMDFPPIPPPWLSFLLNFVHPLILTAVARRMRMSFYVPLCETDKKSVLGRFRILKWSLFGLVIVEILGLFIAADVSGGKWVLQPTERLGGKEELVFVKNGFDPAIGVYMALGAAMGLALCVAAAILLQQIHKLRVKTVTDFTITLSGVSPAFVRAYVESCVPVPLPDDSVTAHWQPGGPRVPPAVPHEENIKQQS